MKLEEMSDTPAFVHRKICLDLYRRESVKIHTMFKELLPTGEVGERQSRYSLNVRKLNAMR